MLRLRDCRLLEEWQICDWRIQARLLMDVRS
jgi:hypothetical protein